MKIFSNLPDQEHVPYKIITHEAHLRDIVRYMRPSDQAFLFGNSILFSGLFVLLEKYKPTTNPKHIPIQLCIVTPFFFMIGAATAGSRVLARFWGICENAREVEKWRNEMREFNPVSKEPWMVQEW